NTLIIIRHTTFHHLDDFFMTFTHQREAPPLDLEHVLEPGLVPTADLNVAAHLLLFGGRFGNQRRKATAVADSKNENAVGIDELVIFQHPKSSPITAELRLEIRFRAN